MSTTDFKNLAGISRIISNAQKQFLPPPDLLPSEWAERNIKIPVGNAVPGFVRFDNAPYQREPLNMTARPDCQRVTLMFAAQVGKTMLALCAQAYRVAQAPTSQIMCQPSQGDLQTWLETKWNPMIEANEELQNLIAKPRGREGVNNQKMKSYPGGHMMFSWAGSPKTMRGRSAPFVVVDETDGSPRTPEGHVVNLLWQRAATFGPQRTLLEISTPTIKGASWIEDAFEQGDQRRFYICCPDCNHAQTLKWSNVIWDKDADGVHLPETAKYTCEECGSLWDDGQRIAAIRNAEKNGGGWRAAKKFRGHASYHLNEMYSIFRRLSDIVQSFLDKKKTNDLLSFTNLSLAETWEEMGEQIDEFSLAERREEMAGIPDDVLFLTAGVDVQDNRLEISVIGWARDDESFVFEHVTLYGDPSTPQLWSALDSQLFKQYTTESGGVMTIRAACIDSGGHFTNNVYAYAKKNFGRRVFAVKGVGGEGRALVGKPSKNNIGKCLLFPVGVDTAKDLLFARLRISEPGPGFIHFNDGLDDEYFRMLTAERVVTRYVRGFKKRVWEKTRVRNEALDTFIYAICAYAILGINISAMADKRDADKVAEVTEEKPKPKRRKPQGGGFVNSWR